jgi:hypothetical protein
MLLELKAPKDAETMGELTSLDDEIVAINNRYGSFCNGPGHDPKKERCRHDLRIWHKEREHCFSPASREDASGFATSESIA